MKPEDIKASVAHAPATIHTADGRSILVSHPDTALVGTRSTAVLHKGEDGMINSLLANHLITSIELAQQPSET